jgi:hypothetical protein
LRAAHEFLNLDNPMSYKPVLSMQWTPELASTFWGDLAHTEFAEQLAFARNAGDYMLSLVGGTGMLQSPVLDYGAGFHCFLAQKLEALGFDVGVYEPSLNPADVPVQLQHSPRFLGVDPGPALDRYQTVFVTEVIEHLPADQGAALLGRLHDSLRPGGHVVVSVPSGENLLLSSRYCPTCRHLFHPWGHVRSFVADTLKSELEKAGFVIDTVLDVDFSAARETIESTKSLRVELGRWSQRLAQLDGQAQAAPVAAMLAEFRQWAVSQSLPEPDVQGGRHIGQGGTLVAIAQRR